MRSFILGTILLLICVSTACAVGWHRGSVPAHSVTPVVTSISPTTGNISGGTTVTINGSGFTNTSRVQLGAFVQNSLTVVNDTQITFVTASRASAAVTNVHVYNPAGTNALGNQTQFQWFATGGPVITQISPTGGGGAGGTVVTVTGINLSTVTGITFGGVAGTSLSCTSTCTVTSPSFTPSTVDMIATNPTATSLAWSYDQFTYTPAGAPVVSSITPTNGSTLGGTKVWVSGQSLTGTVSATVGGVSVTPTNVNDSLVTLVTPVGTGSNNHIIITTNNGASSPTSADTFRYSDFTQVFTPGTYATYMGGTETRDIEFVGFANGQTLPDGTVCGLARCPVLFAFTGFWEDNNCHSSTQGPQAIAYTSSFGVPILDNTFPAGSSGCAPGVFDVMNATHSFTILYNSSGTAINHELLVGSGTDKKLWLRDNTKSSNSWVSFNYTDSYGGVSRAIGDYIDTSGGPGTYVHYVLMGNDADGIHSASFVDSPSWAFTIANAPEGFCFSATGTTCNTPCVGYYGAAGSDMTCPDRNSLWPSSLSVTSASSSGGKVTLNWATPLLTPISPNLSLVNVTGVTCSGGVAPSGTILSTAATNTSVTVVATGTGCSGGTVTTPTPNAQQVTFHWAGAITAPTGTVNVAGVNGCTGTNPDGNNKTITSSNSTSLTITSATNCSAFTLSSATVSCTACSGGSSMNKTITSVNNCPGDAIAGGTVTGCSIPSMRVTGVTYCGVSSGGNANGQAAFLSAGMAVWKRTDNLGSSFWVPFATVPYTGTNSGAAFPTGQGQLRGMTCIIDTTKASKNALLFHIEGDNRMWSLDPDTGVFNVEANLGTVLSGQWGGTMGYQIDMYNSQGVYSVTAQNGNSYYVFGEGDAYTPPAGIPYEQVGGKVTSGAGMFIRSASTPSAPTYTAFPGTISSLDSSFLANIAPNTLAAANGGTTVNCTPNASHLCPNMISTRVGPIPSQFPEDQDGNGNPTVYFSGGMDRNGTPAHDTAWVGRFPQTLNTAWPP